MLESSQVIERLHFVKYPKNSIVFEQGNDQNKDFYIILSGSVEVWVREAESKSGGKKGSSKNLMDGLGGLLNPEDGLGSAEESNTTQREADKMASIQEIVDCNSALDKDREDIHKSEVGEEIEKNTLNVKSRLEKQASMFVNRKLSQTSIGGIDKESKQQIISQRKKNFMIFPTPKTESEIRQIKSTLFSQSESTKARDFGYKYLPLLGETGVNLDSPSIGNQQLKIKSIVVQSYF